MRLYLVRHGETHANAAKRFAGHWDVSLTDKGIKQAQDAGHALKGVHFHQAFSSDLERARETATWILKDHEEVTLITDPSLREMFFGDWEELTFEEIKNKDPQGLNQWFEDYESYVVPNGESVSGMGKRVFSKLETILTKDVQDSDQNILVVAHGGVIQAILSFLLYNDLSGYWRFGIDNCGINIVEYVMDMPVLKGLNKRSLED